MSSVSLATIEETRKKVATANRIIAKYGLCVPSNRGHVSARIPGTDRVLIKGVGMSWMPRGGDLLHTTPGCVVMINLNGEILEDKMINAHRISPPGEAALHLEIYKARKDVNAVVHTHQHAVIACSVANYTIKPVTNMCPELVYPPAPVFPRGVHINTSELGREVAKLLGNRFCAILKGHGEVLVGDKVETAVFRAVSLGWLAKVNIMAASLGTGVVEGWPTKDIELYLTVRGAIEDFWPMMELEVAEYAS